MKITKETLRRAGRTFLQAAIPYIATNICIVDFSQPKEIVTSAIVGLIVSAGAAGIAAVMNLEKTESEE